MSEGQTAFLVVLAFLLMALVASISGSAAVSSVVTDCDSLGSFRVGDRAFTCKAVSP